MKKLALAGAVAVALYFGWEHGGDLRHSPGKPDTQVLAGQNDLLADPFTTLTSGSQVAGEGTVKTLLRDDAKGSRHQRFILSLPAGRTLLIAHNIDLVPRLNQLKTGDTVAFSGVYEQNNKGGVVHWTHHDPQGRHPAGWLKHAGKTYQ